jgi:thiol-disulfide isomerase/thioredoxin
MQEIRSFEAAEKAIAKAQDANKPLVIKFYAPWCEPCRQVASWFDAFAVENAGVARFAMMNIDHDDDIVRCYGIKTIPAFHIWNRGVRAGVFGRDPEGVALALKNVIKTSADTDARHMQDAEASRKKRRAGTTGAPDALRLADLKIMIPIEPRTPTNDDTTPEGYDPEAVTPKSPEPPPDAPLEPLELLPKPRPKKQRAWSV